MNPTQVYKMWSEEAGNTEAHAGRVGRAGQVDGLFSKGKQGGGRGAVDWDNYELTDYALAHVYASVNSIPASPRGARVLGGLQLNSPRNLQFIDMPPNKLVPRPNKGVLTSLLTAWGRQENAKDHDLLADANHHILPGRDLRTGFAGLVDLVTQKDGTAILSLLKECGFVIELWVKWQNSPHAAVKYYDNDGCYFNGYWPSQEDIAGPSDGARNPIVYQATLNSGHLGVLAQCWADTKTKRHSTLPIPSPGSASSSAPGDETVEAPERESAGTLPEAPAPTPTDHSSNHRHQNGPRNSPNSKVSKRARARGSEDCRWAQLPTTKDHPSDAYA